MSTDRKSAGGRGERADRGRTGGRADSTGRGEAVPPDAVPPRPAGPPPAHGAGPSRDAAAHPPRPAGPTPFASPFPPAAAASEGTERPPAAVNGRPVAARPTAGGTITTPRPIRGAGGAPSAAHQPGQPMAQQGGRPGSGPEPQPRPSARTRRARLRAARVDPWSVMKVGFLLSLALGVVLMVAVTVLWLVLDGLGVFTSVGDTVKEATQSENNSGFDLQHFLSLKNTLFFSGIVAIVDVILVTALATLGAFLYNLTASFTGGIEVTLAEED
ncbi:DUF3566 domain-containing protein [Embleya sp. MST-111070]|uniref:DUF3566 domain-containing protein n=1 Tax=Embleya sp. MST-111070 TaxID=3398231 RepID=UPI003F73A5D0